MASNKKRLFIEYARDDLIVIDNDDEADNDDPDEDVQSQL